MGQPRLFVSAGDPSGDLAVARVVGELRKRFPDLETSGLGGERLKKTGQHQLVASESLSVMGFWEVAKRFRFFRGLLRKAADEIERMHPSAVLLVDYPGFNLRLAKRVKPLGIPILYYISPQVWAWGKGRLAQIRDLVDRMLVILPFEEPFYRTHGVKADFVGHYLMEDIPAEYIGSHPRGGRQLGLLPGSRLLEVARMLPGMLKAASEFNRKHGWQAVVAARRGVCDYEAICGPFFDHGISIVFDDARRVVYESDLVLCASGTATLEAGIIGRPMVVVYKTGWMTYLIARSLVALDKIALINLVLEEKIVPELIQGAASPARMVTELGRYVEDADYRGQVESKLHSAPARLGGTGASERAAEEIARYL